MKKFFFSGIIILLLASCGGEKKTAYQCPMKCEGDKTYAAAGECPLCKMELKEVK
jgi:protein SCO1